MNLDRVKSSFAKVVAQLSYGPVDFRAFYGATIVSQAADDTVGLRPDDARIPSVDGCALAVPGGTAKVTAGQRCMLGWNGADPSKPYATLWGSDGLTTLEIGTAADFVAMAAKVKTDLDAIVNAFNTHVHVTPSGPSDTPTPVPDVVPITINSDTSSTNLKAS